MATDPTEPEEVESAKRTGPGTPRGETANPLADSEAKADPGRPGLPSIDFATFILSLSTTALYQMGFVPDPATGHSHEPDPTLARQTIDTLEMLREKTRGNLDAEEDQLFESLLYELRLRVVEIDR